MAKQGRTKNELIKCEYCGEMYSVTYKHCPFCNEDGTGRWDDPDTEPEEYYDEAPRGGGKRLAGGGRGGERREPLPVGRIIAFALSLALIIAAAGIVFSIVRSLLGEKKPPEPKPSAAVPVESATMVPTPSAEPSQGPEVSDPTIDVSQPPAPIATTPSVNVVKPTSFTLNREDFTFDAVGQIFDMKATFTPANATAEVKWTSSDPNIAAVSWNGRVTAVSQGTVTLTATVEGVGEQKCIVRCNFKGVATVTTPPTSTSAAPAETSAVTTLSLNRDDFTLSREGETWRLIVSGTSSPVTWTSSDPAVATVGADGTVTAVSKGTCRVTAEVDGVSLKCIVRCSF